MNKLILSLVVLLSGPVFAGSGGKHMMNMKNMTPEQRKEMAANHDKMAACLRSDKPMSDCKKEMQSMMSGKDCPMMGEKGCPMMDHE